MRLPLAPRGGPDEAAVVFRHKPGSPAHFVHLMGDVVHWYDPRLMAREAGGAFAAAIRLGTGTYVYKYRVGGGTWELDAHNPRTRSVDGDRNNLLVVGGADEPILHAPAPPYLSWTADGRLLVRAGLRRGAGDTLSLWWDEGHGGRDAAMAVVAEEDEHLLFEVALPASARAIEYLFILPGGQRLGRSGGPGQALRASIQAARPELPAWWQEAVLYTIFVDRFRKGGTGGRFPVDLDALPERLRAGGDLPGVTEAIPYLCDLGVTALHLTPVTLSRSAHRYDSIDPRAVDPALGGEASLSALLEAAHRRGLRVLLDIPVTHVHKDFWAFRAVRDSGLDSPYARWFYCYDYPFREGHNPGYQHYVKAAWDEPLLRADHPEVAEYLIGTFEHWTRFGADGFRIDAAADIPQDLARRITSAVKAIRGDAVVYGEIIPDNLHRWTAGAIDAATDFPAQGALQGFLLRGEGASRAASILARRRFARTGPGQSTLAFTATHDQARLLSRAGDPAIARLGHLLVLMRAAVPAILYGDEIGLKSDAPARNFEDVWPDRAAMPWDEAAWDAETLAFFRRALRVRREHPALLRGDEAFLAADPPDEEVLILRRSLGPEIADVILRRGSGRREVALPRGAPSGAEVLIAIGEAAVDVDRGVVTLGPRAGVVIARRAPPAVEAAISAMIAENRSRGAEAFHDGLTASLSLPANLYLTVTEGCNLRCRHCITDAPERTRSGTARQMAPWVLDALREAFAAADYFGFVHGGEAITSPVFPEVLRAIQRARGGRPCDVHLLTNGALLDGEQARRLIDLGVNSLAFSLDGASAATNDAIRAGGRFASIIANLRAVIAARAALGADLRVGISMVAGHSAAAELPAMGRLAVDLGVDWLKIEEMVPATPFAIRERMRPPPSLDALRDAIRGSALVLVDHLDPPRACRCEAEGRPEVTRFRDADDFANRARFHPCRAAWEQACVDPDGAVRPVDYHHALIGNLNDAPLFALWHGEEMRALRSEALARAPAERRARCAAAG